MSGWGCTGSVAGGAPRLVSNPKQPRAWNVGERGCARSLTLTQLYEAARTSVGVKGSPVCCSVSQ